MRCARLDVSTALLTTFLTVFLTSLSSFALGTKEKSAIDAYIARRQSTHVQECSAYETGYDSITALMIAQAKKLDEASAAVDADFRSHVDFIKGNSDRFKDLNTGLDLALKEQFNVYKNPEIGKWFSFQLKRLCCQMMRDPALSARVLNINEKVMQTLKPKEPATGFAAPAAGTASPSGAAPAPGKK